MWGWRLITAGSGGVNHGRVLQVVAAKIWIVDAGDGVDSDGWLVEKSKCFRQVLFFATAFYARHVFDGRRNFLEEINSFFR